MHDHYKKDVTSLKFIDVYRVCKLFAVTDPCIQHALKKLLCAGRRGAKSESQDVQEAIDTLTRYQEMQEEAGVDVSQEKLVAGYMASMSSAEAIK